MSFGKRNYIRSLEKRKQQLLSKEEALWRLKSRALWLKEGDRNTKFFHNFANAKRRRNAIWKIEDGKGGFFYSQEQISNEAVRVFQEQYKRKQSNASDLLWAAEHTPEMFDESSYENFIKPVSEDELLAAMKASKKDKSPSPDGWPIEFFLHFYDLFKEDLLRMERNIWDAVALTQECLFSLRTNNIKAAILKIDLTKAYDCVDWGLLRILLVKIGLRRNGIEWIMACVENINFSVIINGTPSPFFKAERGLRQGCPLSPLLFILVMNTLSIHLNKAASGFSFKPIKISKDFYLSHNLFVDDILIFAMLCKASWQCLFLIIDRFQSASGICINKEKSKLYHNESNMETVSWIASLFGIEAVTIRNGIKYLGFLLKPTGNKKGDWSWLLDRFYKRISGWEIQLLSLAGRLILVQVVLSQLAIYWAHLFFLPTSVIHKMKSSAANFLWGGKSFQSKFHLVKMDSIAKSKKSGGWGLLDMRTMGNALLRKSILRGIYGNGPWSKFINRKYLKGKSIEFWYRRNTLGIKQGSAIWLSFRKNQSFLMRNFRWKLFIGTNIFIGYDFIQDGLTFHLQSDLVPFLQMRGIFTWDKLIKSWTNSTPVWKEAADLSMPPHFGPMWDSVQQKLQGLAIRRSGTKDVLAWNLPRAPSPVRVKDIYAALSIKQALTVHQIFPFSLWKAACPLKMVLFSWLLFWNRNLTWEVLQKKGWQGPGRCTLCSSADETNHHLFFQCQASLQIWYDLSLSKDFPYLVFPSVQDGFFWWSAQTDSWRTLFLLVCWIIWKWRNNSIFNSYWRPTSSILLSIKAFLLQRFASQMPWFFYIEHTATCYVL
eukprot:PITA_14556